MTITRRLSRMAQQFGYKPTTDQEDAAARARSSSPAATSLGTTPTIVIVPIGLLNHSTRRALKTATSMKADETIAIHVCEPNSRSKEREFAREWDEWNTGITMVLLAGTHEDRSSPIVDYIRRQYAENSVLLLISPAMPLRCKVKETTTYNYATHLQSLLHDEQNVTVCRPASSVLPARL